MTGRLENSWSAGWIILVSLACSAWKTALVSRLSSFRRVMMMRRSRKLYLAALLVGCAWSPLLAQQQGRQQDGFYSGQANAKYNGQVDERVDGRANKNEGLPPSVADKGNRAYDNPVRPDDCAEVDALRPEARRGWQARVRAACGQD
ncbi:MAG TPA: hypothetical protein VJV58_13970 [Bradyrhizobium sp.]|uniref:hypothetical protein n=1 Tax=Bradyrhizobium sp. TaxID=376 RepID=UPI002B47594B|nr:hypothetical protein [Bradyrhizobium sp.]HKO72030.1 hypothetical protein [Bradyrhizobium sp.]